MFCIATSALCGRAGPVTFLASPRKVTKRRRPQYSPCSCGARNRRDQNKSPDGALPRAVGSWFWSWTACCSAPRGRIHGDPSSRFLVASRYLFRKPRFRIPRLTNQSRGRALWPDHKNTYPLTMNSHFVVLDQNYLRHIDQALLDAPSQHFVIPDVALMEMCKSEHWEKTMRGSLRLLAPVASRVHVAYALPELMRSELNTKQPYSGHPIFKEATRAIRQLLCEIDADVDGPQIAKMRSNMDDQRREMESEYLDHATNREIVRDLLEVTDNALASNFKRGMRSQQRSREELLNTIFASAPGLLWPTLNSARFSEAEAVAFIARRPMLLRYLYVQLLMTFGWIETGGFLEYPAKRVSNDLIDRHYVLTATSFDGLLTKEKWVNSLYRDLNLLLSR